MASLLIAIVSAFLPPAFVIVTIHVGARVIEEMADQ